MQRCYGIRMSSMAGSQRECDQPVNLKLCDVARKRSLRHQAVTPKHNSWEVCRSSLGIIHTQALRAICAKIKKAGGLLRLRLFGVEHDEFAV